MIDSETAGSVARWLDDTRKPMAASSRPPATPMLKRKLQTSQHCEKNDEIKNGVCTLHERRDHLAIIADILSLAKKPVNKTRIMYKANLSYSMSRKYIDELLSLSLLERCFPRVQITEKGAHFLEKYEELMNWLVNTPLASELKEPTIEFISHSEAEKQETPRSLRDA